MKTTFGEFLSLKRKENGLKVYKSLFTNVRYMTFIIFYMLIVGSTFASDGLFSTFLQEVKDVDNFGYGLINGLFVSFEAITLFILTKRKKHVHT